MNPALDNLLDQLRRNFGGNLPLPRQIVATVTEAYKIGLREAASPAVPPQEERGLYEQKYRQLKQEWDLARGAVPPQAILVDESRLRIYVTDICRELYDRFAMGGWEPIEMHEWVIAEIKELIETSPAVPQPTAQADPFSKRYKHRHGEPVSDACGDGKHSECTQDLTKCHCTVRGGHTTMHAYGE